MFRPQLSGASALPARSAGRGLDFLVGARGQPPELRLLAEAVPGLASNGQAIARIAHRLARMLRVYPHFVVLKGLPPTEDRALSVTLARALANMPPVKFADAALRQKVSFTRVHIDEADAGQKGKVTRYSRTNRPLALHTDSSYKAEPHELVMFQMVRAAADGGDTVMAAVEDIVEALDEPTRTTLAAANFPFGRGPQSVLWQTASGPHIRYYRDQIETGRSGDDPLTDRDLVAMEVLDAALDRPELQYRFHVAAGETMFIHNTKALHGRTGFAADSDRLMYRIRMHAGCLA